VFYSTKGIDLNKIGISIYSFCDFGFFSNYVFFDEFLLLVVWVVRVVGGADVLVGIVVGIRIVVQVPVECAQQRLVRKFLAESWTIA
jgi:hypothetical protein